MDIEAAKREICAIGRQLYERQYVAAHDGNITLKVGDNEFLCTPTLTSKGSMKPEDIATINADGEQIAGPKKRSSEALLHLKIYLQRPEIQSVVHCHPPHATAFGIAREPIPQGVLPEVEVYLGEVPITPYETPGSEAFADTILPFVREANAMILANHGTVTYGTSLQQAFWRTDVLDSYCRMLILAKQLGGISYLSEENVRALLRLKEQSGLDDPRNLPQYKHVDVRKHGIFRDTWDACGVVQSAFATPQAEGGQRNHKVVEDQGGEFVPKGGDTVNQSLDIDQLVKVITTEVLRQLRDPRDSTG